MLGGRGGWSRHDPLSHLLDVEVALVTQVEVDRRPFQLRGGQGAATQGLCTMICSCHRKNHCRGGDALAGHAALDSCRLARRLLRFFRVDSHRLCHRFGRGWSWLLESRKVWSLTQFISKCHFSCVFLVEIAPNSVLASLDFPSRRGRGKVLKFTCFMWALNLPNRQIIQ